MKRTVNELGNQVIYVVADRNNHSLSFSEGFMQVEASLEVAEQVAATNESLQVIEWDIENKVFTPMEFIQGNFELKMNLLSLYKTGDKREVFEGLEVRKPFQNQVRFPLMPEFEKVRAKMAEELQV